jgi:RNA polymerase sigma-70 factor (ECF subfamily)
LRGILSVTDSPDEVTQLLLRWGGGDEAAFARLTEVVYAELHRQARGYMARERRAHTLQATALVNEVYLKLVDTRRVRWQSRAHFMAVAARLMRRILVDHARGRNNLKRGGGLKQVTLEETQAVSPEFNVDLLALDEVLKELSVLDPRKEQVVELRFFGGLSLEETAEALQVSEDTVERDWNAAKAWLLRALKRRSTEL